MACACEDKRRVSPAFFILSEQVKVLNREDTEKTKKGDERGPNVVWIDRLSDVDHGR